MSIGWTGSRGNTHGVTVEFCLNSGQVGACRNAVGWGQACDRKSGCHGGWILGCHWVGTTRLVVGWVLLKLDYDKLLI